MRRLTACFAALVAAAVPLGCGGGEEEDASSSSRQAERAEAQVEAKAHNEEVRDAYERRQQDAAPTPEEQEAEEAAADFYAILGKDEAKKDPNRAEVDSVSFCELMSEEAVAQTIHYAKVSSGIARQWDCESAVELLILRSKRTGGYEQAQAAKVVGINAEGEQATATIRFGNGTATTVPLVRENGEWKLAATPVPGGR